MAQIARVGTVRPSRRVLTECLYCGKFTGELDRHGPGRCIGANIIPWPRDSRGRFRAQAA